MDSHINPIKMMIVDHQNIVRAGLKKLVESAPDIEVVAQSDSGEEAINLYKAEPVDIVLMEINMPGMGGFVATQRLLRLNPALSVLLISMYQNPDLAAKALKIGAKGFICKCCSPDELLHAIRMVKQGRTFLDAETAQALAIHSATGKADTPIDVLTPREFEVFVLLAQGLPVKEIYPKLYLSPKTVNVHRANILDKLHAKNAAELARIAIRHHIIEA
ncbi:MAG: response regulator transcription factor [Mariprofundaceae bacterium]|nr:response regulator transcription factor [Mariprofundaceae bacterium]